MFAKSAFKALGRLLHFLKTTKVKDMTEESCERLQLLWEEQSQPSASALRSPEHLHHASASSFHYRTFDVLENEIKRRMRDVDAMESEVQMRKAVVAVAKKDLAKMEEHISGIDMDSELGFGPKDQKMA
ncbi:uncharacterized protein LOC125478356 [Pyrus x bretschneideri]|uniref:uncharacterized protein LOC125478356 n=1 Tax=Pyrus x bretschneideri TaxID=225117 RepID=UPI00202E39F3|nr:uncharacterized protein LOC125478356 [Pyrus x bretschneideri]